MQCDSPQPLGSFFFAVAQVVIPKRSKEPLILFENDYVTLDEYFRSAEILLAGPARKSLARIPSPLVNAKLHSAAFCAFLSCRLQLRLGLRRHSEQSEESLSIMLAFGCSAPAAAAPVVFLCRSPTWSFRTQ